MKSFQMSVADRMRTVHTICIQCKYLIIRVWYIPYAYGTIYAYCIEQPHYITILYNGPKISLNSNFVTARGTFNESQ